MSAKKFELFLGCFGNGTTVCNKAVMEHGDYKMVAHISNRGHIKWYVSDKYCPIEEKQRIENYAENVRKEATEEWNKLPLSEKVERMMDEFDLDTFLELVNVKNSNSLDRAVMAFERQYFDLH